MWKNGFIRKLRLISKFRTSQSGKKSQVVQYPRCKCIQIRKFGQLIENNMRNIFFENLYTKSGGEASPRPVSKNKN